MEFWTNLGQDNRFFWIGIFLFVFGCALKWFCKRKEYVHPFVSCLIWIIICSGFILGLYEGCSIIASIFSVDSLVAVNYGTGNGQIPVSAITTTLFTTLMTVNLALIALAVTAYVFLDSALNGRDIFEKNLIDKMMDQRTKELIVLSGYTGVGVILCLIVDNGEPAFCKEMWFRHCIILAASLDIIFLIIFIYNIIAYEKCLCSLAVSNIRDLVKKIGTDSEEKTGDAKSETDVIKIIGDLEIFVNQILSNHEVEYRYPQHKKEMLNAIFDAKLGEGQTEDALETNKRMCSMYFELLELRDSYLCIRKNRKNILKLGEICRIQGCAEAFLNFLKRNVLKGERLIDQNFSRVSFSGTDKASAQLANTSFRESAISDCSFDYSDLNSADFTDVVFHNVSMKSVECRNAVFSKAKFYDFIISEDSIFERAVFRGADFNGNRIGVPKTENGAKYDFHEVCLENANLENCKIENINFNDSVFRQALLSQAKIDGCQFNYTDFVSAAMAGTVLSDCSLDYSNMEKANGVYSSWTGCNAKSSRMAKANFTEAVFKDGLFNKVYANDSTFSGVILENCHFEYAMMNSIDFSYAQIDNCYFNESNMANLLLVGDKPCNNTVFSGVNFNNAQIKNIVFYNCEFDNAIFNNAMLKDVVFQNCSFLNTQFDSAFLMNVEWKECRNCDREPKEEKEEEAYLAVREVICRRRSTRNFDEAYVISEKDQNLILEAGLRAPSPKNRQPWHFSVVREARKRADIAELMETELESLKKRRIDSGKEYTDLDMALQTAAIIREASLILFVGYDYDEANEHGETMNWGIHARGYEAADLQAIGAAVQNMLLQAAELGIASLWMCDVLYVHDALRELLQLKHPFVAAVAFGKALPAQSSRKKIGEKVEWIDE